MKRILKDKWTDFKWSLELKFEMIRMKLEKRLKKVEAKFEAFKKGDSK